MSAAHAAVQTAGTTMIERLNSSHHETALRV
jgi:hypothetical protein